ncbi:MAG: hypothetical protein J0I34_18395 [Pseudonocardia sp.]|uniref:hypothetical protein n=1 Tax=unclassified Pseudonocardia TaxID=2619320 RepID=UPI00086D224D|nr:MULTISPECIES: hypothetical protein [unclassified Pseudonocardia]MBN9110736.1 hypothetical protein [Pseudonocardia sp.]ODU27115.1 MAG: hypothetical protein ABS80_04530 [Pseudonocardia sp. SCN 72-51]ODV04438.1 MAG: hypothetical protein ABT15_20920 [Pseudonocardia sp. SCN 73-27]
MVTSTPVPVVPRRHWSLAGLEGLIALSAVYGGIGLVAANAIGMPDEWLVGTPFGSWALPGVLLLTVVAAPMAAAAMLELRRSPWAAIGSVAAGAAQVGWIAGELLIMQRYNVLQPVMMLLGLLVVLVAVTVRRREPLWPPSR